jgi:hypothetical protein
VPFPEDLPHFDDDQFRPDRDWRLRFCYPSFLLLSLPSSMLLWWPA